MKSFRDEIAERNLFLAKIGFVDYSTYLASSLWEWIVGQLSQDERTKRCACCNSRTGLQWHHRSYAPWVMVGNFSNPQGTLIVRLCMACHMEVHTEFPPLAIVDERLYRLSELLGSGVNRSEAFAEVRKITECFQFEESFT